MDKIDSLTNAVIGILGVGAVLRISYCLLCTMVHPDEADSYKKRGQNAFVFVIIALGAFVLKNVAVSYFK